MTGGEHWSRYYNYTHQLTRKLIACVEGGHVINPWHFCLDAEHDHVFLLLEIHGHKLITRVGAVGELEYLKTKARNEKLL